MRLLPSDRETRVQKTIHQLEDMKNRESILISEPCNCGSHIQHNNGGNYHGIITIAMDTGSLFCQRGTTCELVESAEWLPITQEEAITIIQDCGDWL